MRTSGPFLRAALQSAVTKAASFSGASLDLGQRRWQELIITLDVTSAERDSADEVYTFFVTTGDGISFWDIVAFPIITTTGAKRYTARVLCDRLAEVTTGTPGIAAEPTSNLRTVLAGSEEGIKTLGGGKVRHGPIGDRIGHELVVVGTVVTGIAYSITIQARG